MLQQYNFKIKIHAKVHLFITKPSYIINTNQRVLSKAYFLTYWFFRVNYCVNKYINYFISFLI